MQRTDFFFFWEGGSRFKYPVWSRGFGAELEILLSTLSGITLRWKHPISRLQTASVRSPRPS